MDEQVRRSVEDASGRIRQVVQRVQALCQMERAGCLGEDASVKEPDMEHLSTTVRAHPCAAGAPHKKQQSQALGRSRGGFSTKVHVSVDALGNPLRFTLTEGQAHDITQADELIDGIESDYVIADRGYDSQRLRERIVEMGATPVIPLSVT